MTSNAETGPNALGQRGLARPESADEHHEVAGAQHRRESNPELVHGLRVGDVDFDHGARVSARLAPPATRLATRARSSRSAVRGMPAGPNLIAADGW